MQLVLAHRMISHSESTENSVRIERETVRSRSIMGLSHVMSNDLRPESVRKAEAWGVIHPVQCTCDSGAEQKK